MPEGVGIISAGRAFVEVLPDTHGFGKALDGQMARVGRRMQSVGRNLTKHVTLPIVAVFAIAADEGLKAEKSIARMDAAYKGAGVNINKYKKRIEEAETAGRKLGFTDNDVREGLGSLIVATKNHTLATKLLGAAQNVARFRHIKLAQATKMLTMTMTGSQRAAKMLGITVSPVTKTYDRLKASFGKNISASEKLRLAHAKLVDKQLTGAKVLKLVNERLHGQAKAFSETAEGKMEVFRANLDHLFETLGTHLIPALTGLVEKLSGALDWFQKLSPGVKKAVVIGLAFLALLGPVVSLVGTLVIAIEGLAGAFSALAAGELLATGPILLIIAAAAALAIGFVILYKKSETFRRIVNASFAAIKVVARAVADFILKHWKAIMIIMGGAVGAALVLIITHWTQFKNIVVGIIRFVMQHWRLLIALIPVIGPVIAVVIGHFRTIERAGVRAFHLVRSAISDAIDVVKTIVKWVKKLVDALGDAAGIVGKVGGALHKLGGVAHHLNPVNLVGDAHGRGTTRMAAAEGRAFGVGRQLWDEIALGERFGLHVSSGYRPGAVTVHGTPSDHGTYPSRAVDMAGSAAGKAALFRSLIGRSEIAQAFYDPLGSIFGGRWSSYREGGHVDHIHVAEYGSGGTVPGRPSAGDIVPAMLTPGEIVLNWAQQKVLGGHNFLAQLFGFKPRSGGFAGGGSAGDPHGVGYPLKDWVKWSDKLTRFMLLWHYNPTSWIGIPTQRMQRPFWRHMKEITAINAKYFDNEIVPWWESSGYYNQRNTRRAKHRAHLLDSGGWLHPGYTLALNDTGRSERVLSHEELHSLSRPGRQRLVIENWHEGVGYIEEISHGSAARMNAINTRRARMSS